MTISICWARSNEGINSEFIPVHAIKTCRECRGMALPILNFSTRWCEWSRSRPGPFTLGNELRYLLDPCIRLAETGAFGGTNLIVAGIRTPDRSLRNLVAKPTGLSHFQENRTTTEWRIWKCVKINSHGLILSTTQARYQKGLRKTAINLSKDFEYEAELPLDGEVWPMFRSSFPRFSLMSYTVTTKQSRQFMRTHYLQMT